MNQKFIVTELEKAHWDQAFEMLRFIYNRFDLFRNSSEFRVLKVENENNTYYVETRLMENGRAEIGGWLLDIPQAAFRAVIQYILKTYRSVSCITIKNCLWEVGAVREKNHFHVLLPADPEDLGKRLSSKHRYNLKRARRLLETDIGAVSFAEYTAETVPEAVMQAYFAMKQDTYDRSYGLSARAYLDEYHVTDVYVMDVNGQIGAVALSCEQFDTVFAENFSYQKSLSRYSCGDLMYSYYLRRLSEKGKTQVYLGGGDYLYKRHYDSVENVVYDCIVHRNPIKTMVPWLKGKIKKQIKDTPLQKLYEKIK